MAEPYSGGCYTAVYAPGFFTTYGPYLREPVGRMYFAGTEVATEWSGYINGAFQAGERAARQVLVKLGKLNSNQVMQTEPTSLEYPPVPFNTTLFERVAPSAKGFLRGMSFFSIVALSTTAVVLLQQTKYNFSSLLRSLRS